MADNPNYPPIERAKKVYAAELPPKGIFDRLLRSGKSVTHGLTLIPIYMIASLLIGCAIAPGVEVYHLITGIASNASGFWQTVATGVGISAGFITYGFAILFIIPLANWPLKKHVVPTRGSFHSSKFLAWYLHNSLTYIVRYSFLDYVTPTPLNHMFYRLMGMKIGKDSQVNTSNISDAALLTIGADVTIGGSATIICHYAQAGYLILAPTVIRNGATIGILATVMAGVDIGEGARILPNSVVLPKTKIPAGETWGGVPAKRITL